MTLPPMMAGAGAPPKADWTAPATWSEQPASQMRAGSYHVGANEKMVDVSIVPLAGEAGGDLANVNRWRGQLGLKPVDAGGLSAISRKEKLGPHAALVVEFASTDSAPKRILAAIVTHNETTWFFKAMGPDAAVRAMTADFKKFVGSVRFRDGD